MNFGSAMPTVTLMPFCLNDLYHLAYPIYGIRCTHPFDELISEEETGYSNSKRYEKRVRPRNIRLAYYL